MDATINKIYFLLEIAIFFSMIYLGNNQAQIIFNNVLFPTTLTLLNQNIMSVESNGIHLFSPELVEDTTKTIFFTKNITEETEGVKVEMVQFPEKDNGYVMVLVSENIYFFESDGTIINKADLKDIIDDDKYCLIPYKKEGNILYYLIAYNDGGVVIIKLFTFNIDTQMNSVNITYSYNIYVKYYEPTNVLSTKIIGINCLFTANSIRDYDILTCFYSTYYPTEIHEKSFDPNNDFEEITELFQYFYLSAEFPLMYSISAMTSLDKQKIIIICVCEQSFWITFNFNDFFSEAKYIFDDNSKLVLSTYNSKLYYFR